MTAQCLPGVDLVIPVYNRLNYLTETLDSVLSQVYQNWDLVVVDDGSEEDVARVMVRYADQRIRYVRQPNQGNAVARNRGIVQGKRDFVICLDSDDVWHPLMLATCISFLESHTAVDVVYTQVQLIDGNGLPLPEPVGPEPRQGDLLESLLMGYPILPSSALMRRSCFERWGTYTPGMDDWELWLRWAAQGCQFACIAQPLLHYRIHDQNFNRDWPRRRATHFAMLDKFYTEHDNTRTERLKSHAYANQHWFFAVAALGQNRWSDAKSEFGLSASAKPSYLVDEEFYYRLACAHQGHMEGNARRNLDLDVARDTLTGLLDTLYDRPDGLPEIVRSQQKAAYAYAYLTLARLAYSSSHDMRRARRFLAHSARYWPGIVKESEWATWYVRTFIGRHAVAQTRIAPRRVFH